jgi:hypothetical protein
VRPRVHGIARTTPAEPARLFADLTYQQWRDGMAQNPTLYWDPYLGVQRLMGRRWTPLHWR